MENTTGISSSGSRKPELTEEKLLAYLEGRLTAEERYEVELWLADEGMESDALEGLYKQNAADTKHTVNRLNRQLKKNMGGKKKRRRPLQALQASWIAVLVVLLLVVIAYIVIRKLIYQ